MKPASFSYVRPSNLDEALTALSQNPDSKLLAGGQSLIPVMNFRLSRPAVLIDINGLNGLDYVKSSDSGVEIGALIRHQQLHNHPVIREVLAVLAEAAGHVGHWAIRNRGTLGGSLSHADPASELPAAMVALDASFQIGNAQGMRTVPAREFYQGFMTTDLGPSDMLVSVSIPHPGAARFGFSEVARRPGDFALAGAFVKVEQGSQGAVTWFGVSGGPEYREVEIPQDAEARRSVWEGLAEELDPLDQPEYRRSLAVTVAEQAYQRATGGQE